MIKCIVILVIVFLVILLINDKNYCENYSGLDKQSDTIPCYQAIKYPNLEKSREYNANDVRYNNQNNKNNYDFLNELRPLSNSVIPMPSM